MKTMKKLVDRHIRDGVLKEYPLHRNQHAYRIGKFTETAIHIVVICVECAIKYKEVDLGAILDIDRTSFGTITQASERHGTEPAICKVISCMMKSRNIELNCRENP
jgi:hypothetical protein